MYIHVCKDSHAICICMCTYIYLLASGTLPESASHMMPR